MNCAAQVPAVLVSHTLGSSVTLQLLSPVTGICLRSVHGCFVLVLLLGVFDWDPILDSLSPVASSPC